MARPDADEWLSAMEDEFISLKRSNVWELCERPKQNVISTRWVLKTKRSPDNEILRYRARLVARGFTQQKGKDYFSTYAPVCDTTSIRILFAYAAARQLVIKQFDVKAAFLYGELNELTYVEQPPGFDNDKSKVYRLNKALYGLKQSSKQWNVRFSEYLSKLGLTKSVNDECIFYQNKPLLILAIYVDDAIILSENSQTSEILIHQLKQEFDIHTIETNVFLGFQYQVNANGSITIHQSAYIKKILEQYSMASANSMATPEATSEVINEELLDNTYPYKEAVGSLMYAAMTTRLDIAHATVRAARASSQPTQADWTRIKRILRYLRGHVDLGITYHPTNNPELTGHCDASFAGEKKYKSTTGYLFEVANGPISWKSKKQTITTTSSTEAEFVALCAATKEAIWLKNLALELSIIDERPIVIKCDNTSTISIAENEQAAKRTRHLGAQIHYPKEQIERGIIKVDFVPGREQLADILTKPLGPQKFIPNCERLMAKIAQDGHNQQTETLGTRQP